MTILTTTPDPLRTLYASIVERMVANPDLSLADSRRMFEELAVLSREPEGVTYAEVHDNDVNGLWAIPHNASGARVVLYFHGGGYMGCSMATHRKYAGHIALNAQARVFLADYRLAPEAQHPAQLADAAAAHRWLLDNGHATSDVAFGGDSAGANLALGATLQAMVDNRAPAAVAVFSPWVDLQQTGESLKPGKNEDALVSGPILDQMRSLFLGETGRADDPLVNVLHADLTGYPPLHVVASTSEGLYSDAERLVSHARAAGVDVESRYYPDEQHFFSLKAGNGGAADDSIRAAGTWLNTTAWTRS